jgi:hypothetical protein
MTDDRDIGINWWIRDLGDHFILMANDSIAAIFLDWHSVKLFVKQFGVIIEKRKDRCSHCGDYCK